MKIRIPYSSSTINIEIPRENMIELLKPKYLKVESESKLLKAAVKNPVNFEHLSSFLEEREKVTMIINDHERPTPTAKILKSIYPYLKSREITILVASGAHRPPTELELNNILGEFYNSLRKHIKIHNCREKSNLTFIGTTSYDTDVYVNNLILQSDGIIVTGSVEPHYFAGFTGGRKFLIPGVAGYETIEHNHMYALDEKAQLLSLDGNPVHEDMMDALELLSRFNDIFTIMTVLDAERRICFSCSGHVKDAFELSVKASIKVHCIELEEKADIVIAVARPPLDISLYQAHKAVEHAKMALKKGGILILVAECREGIGPRNFYDLLSSSNSPQEVFEKVKDNYRLGYHKAARLANLLSWAELWAYTSMNQDLLRKIFIKPCSNLQKAVSEALKEKGRDAKILIIDDAALLVPTIKNK
ncbi:MAG: nickel-dependent lactate racemase [archaeon GB-1867-005]|nr:nickel-dependent lactate racemase [Candidatus Culexmicrobium cathedralense]